MLRCRDLARGRKDLSDTSLWSFQTIEGLTGGGLRGVLGAGYLYCIQIISRSQFHNAIPKTPSPRPRRGACLRNDTDLEQRPRKEPPCVTSLERLAEYREPHGGTRPQAYQASAQALSQDSHRVPTKTGRAVADRSFCRFRISLEPVE